MTVLTCTPMARAIAVADMPWELMRSARSRSAAGRRIRWYGVPARAERVRPQNVQTVRRERPRRVLKEPCGAWAAWRERLWDGQEALVQ
jgi:hypothetical protein